MKRVSYQRNATLASFPSLTTHSRQISTGTAVAPFLQLLSKTPITASTRFTLLHQQPLPTEPAREDWSASYIAPLQEKWGNALDVRRIPAGTVQRADVSSAIGGAERLLVLVCLPTP